MKERIVNNAWELVSNFHSLKKLNFLPSLFSTTWLFLILIYQIAYTIVTIFGKKDEVFHFLIEELPQKTYFIPIVISIIGIFLFYTILSAIARGGMIHMMHTYRKNEGSTFHRSWQGFFDGLSHFLPIFEIQNITGIFAPLTIITSSIFLIRILGIEFATMISIGMGIYLLFSFMLNMCFSYAPFFVIFEDKKAKEALSSSTGLAVRNISITAQLYFTNLLLYLRIILVGGLFLLMPFIISSTLAYFTITSVKILLVIIFSGISFILFVLIVYLNSVLEIFILALWYEAFLVCKEQEKKLHI